MALRPWRRHGTQPLLSFFFFFSLFRSSLLFFSLPFFSIFSASSPLLPFSLLLSSSLFSFCWPNGWRRRGCATARGFDDCQRLSASVPRLPFVQPRRPPARPALGLRAFRSPKPIRLSSSRRYVSWWQPTPFPSPRDGPVAGPRPMNNAPRPPPSSHPRACAVQARPAASSLCLGRKKPAQIHLASTHIVHDVFTDSGGS